MSRLVAVTFILVTLVSRAGLVDAGCDWIEVDQDLQTHRARLVFPTDRNVAWVAGGNQAGYARYPVLTTDGGVSWQYRGVNTDEDVSALYAFDDQRCLVAVNTHLGPQGNERIVFHTEDGGTTWNEASPRFLQYINAIHFFDQDNGWLMHDPVGGRFGIWTTADGGQTWTESPASPSVPQGVVWGYIDSFAWVGTEVCVFGTDEYQLIRTENGGQSWEVIDFWFFEEIYCVTLSESGYGLAGGGGLPSGDLVAPLCRTTDFGKHWAPVQLPLTLGAVLDVEWVPGTSEAWIFAQNEDPFFRGWLHSTNNGVEWTICDAEYNYMERDLEFLLLHGGPQLELIGWAVGWHQPDESPWLWKYQQVIGIELLPVPAAARLALRASPNPFSLRTALDFEAPRGQGFELRIYDGCGRLVRNFDRGSIAPTARSLTWDGHDDQGSPVASGVYLARLESGGESLTRKLVLTR